MKVLICILFFICLISCKLGNVCRDTAAGWTSEISDEKKSKLGKTKYVVEQYETGKIKVTGKEKLKIKTSSTNSGRLNGVGKYWKHGKWKTYYKNGNLESIVSYKYGDRHGVSVYYQNDGKIISKEKYKNRKLIK